MLLPAHGPVAPSSHARVDELLAHHDDRLEQMRDAVAGGASTAWDVAGEIGWTRHERKRSELGPFDAVLAAFETLATWSCSRSRATWCAPIPRTGPARYTDPGCLR